jgi:transposase
LVRTYAPKGQTPLLRVPLSRDHVSAMSGITPTSRLFLKLQRQPLRGPDCVAFLRQLARQIRGRLLVLWDGASIHRAQPVKDFLRTPTGRRIRLAPLPGYAPELNPDEGIWQHLKHGELKNVRCQDLDHLEDEVRRAAKRLRHKRSVIQGCIHHALAA